MFVCLSSGYRPRYRRDIARSLALPAGTALQFRYGQEWILPAITARLGERKARKKLRGTPVLIAYADQADESKEIDVVPCRYATLVDAAVLGRTVSLQLQTNNFAHAPDLAAFNDELRSRAPTLARRSGTGIEGHYWVELNELADVQSSGEIGFWEATVSQIAARRDFATERFFYVVDGIADVAKDEVLRARKNTFNVRPGRDYDLRLYHYHPTEGDPDAEVGLTAMGAPVAFTMTPEALLDSRYDLKRIRFRTGSPVPAQRGVLTLRRRRLGSDAWEWDFDIGVRVRAAVLRQLFFGLVVAAFLAVTPIVAAYSNPKLSSREQLIIAVVGGASSLLAGITAAFGLRRSL
jgi:hypothetical protein